MGTSDKPRDDRPVKGGDKWHDEIEREVDKASRQPAVFISYSHRDEAWKDRLRPHLKMLEQAGRIRIWDDRSIDGGAQWYDEIKQAMDDAAVAVCLISADYLASDFCTKEEIPYLLERRERDGMLLLPVLVRPCAWKVAEWLSKTQMLPRDGKSVSKDFQGNEDEVFALVAETIFDKLDNPNYCPPPPPPPQWPPLEGERIEIGRLPVTGSELFGRQKELELLDAAWSSEETNVVSLVAWGGVGKSTLVNKWLERMSADNYRGARRVFAWSFYSQGTGERVISADQFINAALIWFGDADPTAGSPWDKGECLARYVQRERTLLLLDGLEPLQSPHAHERGKIKDPALLTLLTELARHNPGLCLITTRERVTDLAEYEPKNVLHKDLEQISDEAGRALLRVGGVQGTDAELEHAVRHFGNHALAVQLLAVYLHDIPGHHVSHAAEIPDLDIPADAGRHPRRVMQALADRFGDSAEVELLRMLGLFDRPADRDSLRALRRAPVIRGLTDRIRKLRDVGWLRTIDKLRRYKLIAPQSTHRPDDLDAHPLVREHFGQELKQHHCTAWREGNSRLYGHLKRTAKELPDTIEEMSPLYAAVAHGCRAGRYEEAFEDVFWLKIRRGNEQFSVKKLGAWGADLSTLIEFCDRSWMIPASTLTETTRSRILGEMGLSLRALGKLHEAIPLLKKALKQHMLAGEWTEAAIRAGNLCKLYIATGSLRYAEKAGRQSIELADKSGDTFRRTVCRAKHARTLHLQGRLREARKEFEEVEQIHAGMDSRLPILFGARSAWYSTLLLDLNEIEPALVRSSYTLRIATEQNWLHDKGLAHMSLGCAMQATDVRERAKEIEYHLDQAVLALRHAGQQDLLPYGLLARADFLYSANRTTEAQRDLVEAQDLAARTTMSLHETEAKILRAKFALGTKGFEEAATCLSEALSIAARGNMGMHEADCHLGFARLYLARGEMERARESWEKARGMIERMGYHRRDRDVREIEEELKKAGG